MPNYVRNVFIFKSPEDKDKVMGSIIAAYSNAVDFNFIASVPNELISFCETFVSAADTNCANFIWDSGTYLSCKLDFDDMYKLAEQSRRSFCGKNNKFVVSKLLKFAEMYGSCSPDDWKRENWGCSANAYFCRSVDSYRYAFTTSWSEPDKFYEKLADKFSDMEFEVDIAWEPESGYGCKIGTFRNGKYTSKRIEPKTEQSNKLCRYVWETM